MRRDELHRERMRNLRAFLARPRRRRTDDHQIQKRTFERALRMRILALVRWGKQRGVELSKIASLLCVKSNTLSNWRRRFEDPTDRLRPHLIGRKLQSSDLEARKDICAVFQMLGPGVSLRLLRDWFPEVPRAQLEQMQLRYRNIYKKKGWLMLHRLRWTMAGSVWAMDFFEPDKPLDHVYPYVLYIRDLASGYILQTVPCTEQCADFVVKVLAGLFNKYAPPLILKCDNGSAFISKDVQKLAEANQVCILHSPPRTPSYNGACEAGIGATEHRALCHALRNDRGLDLSVEDLWVAREQANVESRLRTHAGPSPRAEWQQRPFRSTTPRDRFMKQVDAFEQQQRQERGILPDMEPSRTQQAMIRRIAIAKAAVAFDLLQIRKQRIPLPIKRLRRGNII